MYILLLINKYILFFIYCTFSLHSRIGLFARHYILIQNCIIELISWQHKIVDEILLLVGLHSTSVHVSGAWSFSI